MFTFDVVKTRGGIAVKMDPDLAHDVCLLLVTLADLMRTIRVKALALEAEKKVKCGRLRKKQEREFDRRALEVFTSYEKLLDAMGHKAARASCKKDFKLTTLAEVDIYLTRGRQLTPENPKTAPTRSARGPKSRVGDEGGGMNCSYCEKEAVGYAFWHKETPRPCINACKEHFAKMVQDANLNRERFRYYYPTWVTDDEATIIKFKKEAGMMLF